MKKIMILGASILQVPAIKKATEMGLSVVVVDMNPLAAGFSIPGVDKEVISTIDTRSILDAAKRHKIDGIMTLATDMPMQSVAVVGQEMGLVGISRDTALKATNKAYMRDALKKSGVPIPAYYRVREKKAFKNAIEMIRSSGCKCIVKPADNSGSRGVYLLASDEDCEKAYDYSMAFSRDGEIIVEEYMEGPEVSVETLAIDGSINVIQITDKITTGSPYYVEMGHSQPSQLTNSVKSQIIKTAIAANEALGIKDGPSHTEIMVTKDGPKIVELGARLGGDCITTHLVPLSTGVDMVKNCILIALGERPDCRIKWNKGAAIRYLDSKEGVIEDIIGIDKAEALSGVIQVSFAHNKGETVNGIRSSGDRIGFVISQGATAKEAITVAETAKSFISVKVNERK